MFVYLFMMWFVVLRVLCNSVAYWSLLVFVVCYLSLIAYFRFACSTNVVCLCCLLIICVWLLFYLLGLVLFALVVFWFYVGVLVMFDYCGYCLLVLGVVSVYLMVVSGLPILCFGWFGWLVCLLVAVCVWFVGFGFCCFVYVALFWCLMWLVLWCCLLIIVLLTLFLLSIYCFYLLFV